MALSEDGAQTIPTKEALTNERRKQLTDKRIEAAVLERNVEHRDSVSLARR